MRVAVIGAGCVGKYVGGLVALGLSESGELDAPVLLVGRSEGADATPLSLEDLTGGREVAGRDLFACTADPAAALREGGGVDLVLVAVKSSATEEVARMLASVEWADGGTGPAVVSLQNGVAAARTLKRALPALDVSAAIVGFNVVLLPPADGDGDCGRVFRATEGDLLLEPSRGARMLLAALGRRRAALVEAREEPRFAGKQWAKLLINLNNAVNALAGAPVLATLRDRGYRRVMAACMDEGLASLRAAGIAPVALKPLLQPWLLPSILRLPNAAYLVVARRALRMDPEARGSMLQDLAARRDTTEVADLNGEFVRLGQRHGVPTPVNAAVVAIVERAAAERAGSPCVPSAELGRLVGVPPPSACERACPALVLVALLAAAAVIVWLLAAA